MVSLYEAGEIQSREDLIAQLEKVGEVRSKKTNTKYISVKFTDPENRIRFDGGIFARDFAFQKKQPGNAQRCQRSANDFLELKPRIKRALHRHELPIADPFGDHDAYLKDIEERYADAFEYRRARFEMIRSRSKRLAVIKAREALDEERARNATVPDNTTEDLEDVDRIREARRRTRDRKHRLANLARKARNGSRYAQHTFTRVGEYLRRAYESLQEFAGRRQAKAKDEKQLRGYLDMVDQKLGIDKWAIALRRASRQLDRNQETSGEVESRRALDELVSQKERHQKAVSGFVGTLPHRFRDAVADAANSVISEIVSEIVTKHPELEPDEPTETQNLKTPRTGPHSDSGPN